MTDNFKDVLEKFAQKHAMISPIYNTNRAEDPGTDHNPFYLSIVTIDNKNFKGEVRGNKKTAESSAAFEALKVLKDSKNEIKNNKKLCILIDFENLQKIDNEITSKELFNKNLDIYVFVGKFSCLVDKKFPGEIIKIISPSGQLNGTDICMMTYVGSLLIKNLYDVYFIATRDKFAPILIEMIKDKNLGWDSKEAHQITKIEHIYDYIKL